MVKVVDQIGVQSYAHYDRVIILYDYNIPTFAPQDINIGNTIHESQTMSIQWLLHCSPHPWSHSHRTLAILPGRIDPLASRIGHRHDK